MKTKYGEKLIVEEIGDFLIVETRQKGFRKFRTVYVRASATVYVRA